MSSYQKRKVGIEGCEGRASIQLGHLMPVDGLNTGVFLPLYDHLEPGQTRDLTDVNILYLATLPDPVIEHYKTEIYITCIW